MGLFILGFGYMLLVYMYGKQKNCFAFDPKEDVAEKYHASMHLVGIAIYTSSMLWFLPA
jgi:DVNP family